MSVILTLLKIIGAVVVGLGVSILGDFIGFLSDIGPSEGPFERVLLMSFFYFLGGLYIGYFLPRVWYLSLAVAWRPLVSITQIIINFNSFMEMEGTARWIILNVSVISPLVALLAGYVGYRIHRRIAQVPPQDRNMPLRHAIGLVLAIPPLFFSYMFAREFFVEPVSISVGDPPSMMYVPADLHSAAEKGDLEEILRQIKLGEDVDIQDITGRTPLHYAVGQEKTAAVELLLSLNASPDIKERVYGDTPLHWAAGLGNLDIVKLLAPAIENIDATNQRNQTAAMIAAADDKQEVLDVLIAHGAKIDTRE